MAREKLMDGKCGDCGATVALKVTVNSRVYYACDGGEDDRQCGARHTMGAGRSKQVIAKAGRPADPPPAADPPKPAVAVKPVKPVKPAQPAPKQETPAKPAFKGLFS